MDALECEDGHTPAALSPRGCSMHATKTMAGEHWAEQFQEGRANESKCLAPRGAGRFRMHLLDLAVRVLQLLGKIPDTGFENCDALAEIVFRQVCRLYLRVGYALRFWRPTARQYSSYWRATSASMLPGGMRSKKSRSRPMSGTSGSTSNCMISLSTASTMS
jgi:hypothetical protein